MTAWDDLLQEFRALGGTAENIRVGHGEFGRGIFPIDPAKPVAIQIPHNLLVDCKQMVFLDGVPRVGPAATVNDRERAWLDRYLEDFGWGGGGGEEVRRMFEMAGALPAELRQSLRTKYGCGPLFEEPSDELIQRRFFEMRSITYRDRPVVMPIIEMVNHGNAAGYDCSETVALRGSFAGEVLVQYSDVDSFDYFQSWGFATQRPVAFSLAIEGSMETARLDVEQTFNARVTSMRSWIPEIKKRADPVQLSFLLLGNMQFPRLPKGIFYQLMREAGHRGFEEAFDTIHHLNRLQFLGLLDQLEDFDLPIARTLRAVARYQLRAMSFCFGARGI
ncbi:MAG TPA: hypothetical protein VHU18_05990 [Rhizomicrobium sp.]|nr:hypothetical protein [Rhizomicrobium sp.]